MGFKSLAVTSLALVTAVSGTAFAQKRAPAQTEKSTAGVSRTSQEKGSDNIAWLKARMTVGAYLSTASSFDAGSANVGFGTNSRSGSGTANTSSAMGVEAQVINMRDENWGLYGSVALEQTREIDSVRLNLGGPSATNISFTKKPFYRPLFVSGGLVYRFNPKFYAIGGFNFSPFKETGSGQFDSSSMESKLGYQVGVAFRPVPRFSLELAQKVQRFGFNGSMKDGSRLNLDDMNLVGFALTGRYSIE